MVDQKLYGLEHYPDNGGSETLWVGTLPEELWIKNSIVWNITWKIVDQ